MKILIVGASGFLGINLILSAPRNWEIIGTYNHQNRLEKIVKQRKLKNIRLIKCDLTDEKQVKILAKKIGGQPINVLYLAGNTDPQLSYREPKCDLEQNTLGILNFLTNIKVNKMIYFSSGAVYSGLRGKVNPNSKLNPILPYAISKYASEQYVKYFQSIKKINNYIIVRFFGAYGPYEPERKIYTKLIKAFYLNKQNTYEVYGDGTNIIDAMYVEQAINAIFKLIQSNKGNTTIDLCNGHPITINELVKLAAELFGIKNLVINHVGKSAEPIQFRASQAIARKKFNLKIKENLKQSLLKFAEYLRNPK